MRPREPFRLTIRPIRSGREARFPKSVGRLRITNYIPRPKNGWSDLRNAQFSAEKVYERSFFHTLYSFRVVRQCIQTIQMFVWRMQTMHLQVICHKDGTDHACLCDPYKRVTPVSCEVPRDGSAGRRRVVNK